MKLLKKALLAELKPFSSLATFAVFGDYIANDLAVLIALILVFWIVLKNC